MTAPQVTGAGLGGVLAGILVNTLHKYAGYDITLTDATAITIAGMGVVGTLAHAVERYGLSGLWNLVWKGKPQA